MSFSSMRTIVSTPAPSPSALPRIAPALAPLSCMDPTAASMPTVRRPVGSTIYPFSLNHSAVFCVAIALVCTHA